MFDALTENTPLLTSRWHVLDTTVTQYCSTAIRNRSAYVSFKTKCEAAELTIRVKQITAGRATGSVYVAWADGRHGIKECRKLKYDTVAGMLKIGPTNWHQPGPYERNGLMVRLCPEEPCTFGFTVSLAMMLHTVELFKRTGLYISRN